MQARSVSGATSLIPRTPESHACHHQTRRSGRVRAACECVRIESSRASASARISAGSVRRIRVSPRLPSKSSRLRGWRPQGREGSSPFFRTKTQGPGVIRAFLFLTTVVRVVYFLYPTSSSSTRPSPRRTWTSTESISSRLSACGRTPTGSKCLREARTSPGTR